MFHDCIGPRVIISDFALGLSSAMCRTRQISRAEAGVEDRMTMLQIDVFGTDVQLQLCAWHAVEAIRKRLIRAGRYPAELQKELQNLLWSWVKTYNQEDSASTRSAILDRLFDVDRNYLIKYYKRQEAAFIKCFTRTYANVGAQTSQTAESSHGPTKNSVSKHTPIEQSAARIVELIEQKERDFEKAVNKERIKRPVTTNARVFRQIGAKITHEAIDRITKEWAVMMRWCDAIDAEEAVEPQGDNECLLQCSLPLQYGLPCKCFLYACAAEDIPIPMTLVHPRWLYDHPGGYTRQWRPSLIAADDDEDAAESSAPAIVDNGVDERGGGG